MNKDVLYWGCMFLALALAILYNVLIARKFKIKSWKLVVCSLILFAFNWGVSYINAFIEAGFVKPPMVNGVRAWIYAPLAFFAFSVMFKINYKRLCDALTPCFILGFAFGKLGCAFAGCCKGIPYDGFCAVYDDVYERFVFPVQIVEAIAAFIVFIVYVIYIVKSKYKVTGRQYPVMLIVYTGRFFFEYLRDNIKIWNGLSALSFHALFGGLVGIIWLFLTTASGKKFIEKTKNFFRKITKKEPLPVLSISEYKNQIIEMQNNLNNPRIIDFEENKYIKLEEIEKNNFNKKVKNVKHKFTYITIVSFAVLVFCILHLLLLRYDLMDTLLVAFFAIFALYLIIFSFVSLFRFNKCIKKINSKETLVLSKPDENVLWLLYNKKAYVLFLNNNNQELKFSKVSDNNIILENNNSELITVSVKDVI